LRALLGRENLIDLEPILHYGLLELVSELIDLLLFGSDRGFIRICLEPRFLSSARLVIISVLIGVAS
jgi:hypothetical protein